MENQKNDDRFRKKLLVEIEEDLHQEVKTYALMRGVSMRCWVRWALQAAVQKEKALKGNNA